MKCRLHGKRLAAGVGIVGLVALSGACPLPQPWPGLGGVDAGVTPTVVNSATAPVSGLRAEPGTDLRLTTDRLAYTLRRSVSFWETAIALRLSNLGRNPRYIRTCRGPQGLALEKLIGDSWIAAYQPIYPACLGPDVVVGPGKDFHHMFDIRAWLRDAEDGRLQEPTFKAPGIPGTYRVVWDIYREASRLPFEAWQPEVLASNPFDVLVPDNLP